MSRRHTQMPGHGLAAEGAAYLDIDEGCTLCIHLMDVPDPPVTWIDVNGFARVHGSEGHGICSCGWTSTHLMSRSERYRQFTDHKDEISPEFLGWEFDDDTDPA